MSRRTPKNRKVGLIVITLATSALIGGLLGWHYPLSPTTPKETLNQPLG